MTAVQYWTRKNDAILDQAGLRRFYRYLNRLERHEPLAQIFKEKEFFSRPFHVNKNVLVPRPETEVLVEQAISLLPAPGHILDIGAGSGIIAITLALETGSTAVALEKSAKAIYILRKNIHHHHVRHLVTAMKGDLFPHSVQKRFDVIVSNPPYLGTTEWADLEPNVKLYDPIEALVSGDTGLEAIEAIIARAPEFLVPGGSLLLEIGHTQKPAVERILTNHRFDGIRFVNDYSGIPRVAAAEWRPE